jgi:protein DJ-1
MLFALTIVELLSGKDKRDEVQGPMVTAENL